MKKIYNTKEEQLQARRNKRRDILGRKISDSKEKFILKTESGCWEWLGQKWPGGYGYVRVKGKTIPAHRYIYSWYKEEIDPTLIACHTCDNPGCVNPDHIFLGTQADNMRDMVSKGRSLSRRGKDNPNYRHGRNIKNKED